ncbi:SLATT domain-containing protein [Curtobacterium sp. MCBA15_004]|uniref:SLATT domain-containing protein n=1 Tax=unclassified Curtobacterium TaxID=257496 RepID=UPI001114B1D8|nr:SLATT domain-containing protein [Curtobacterium sp. MCBA15_004]WIA97183.1 SLATT domain-containing protein [Curtobacterium sp. MCBA15_004]
MSEVSRDELSKLHNRVARTYHAHLSMAKRLQRRDRLWNAALIVLSCVSVIAAVALLSDERIYGERGDLLWASIGIVTLAVTLVVTNADYRVRSTNAFTEYRELQRLWVDLDRVVSRSNDTAERLHAADDLNARYQKLLDMIPNHSGADFFANMTIFSREHPSFNRCDWSHFEASRWDRVNIYGARLASGTLTALPVVLAITALAALVPVAGGIFSKG